MPPLVAAAAVTAAGAVIGGVVASRAANKATKAQQQSTADALTYERQRQTTTDNRYQMAWDDYQTRHKAWEARNFGGATPAGKGGSAPVGGGGFTQTGGLAPGQLQMAGQAPTAAYGPGAAPSAAPGTAATVQGDQAGMAQPQDGVNSPWQDWKQYLGGMGNGAA